MTQDHHPPSLPSQTGVSAGRPGCVVESYQGVVVRQQAVINLAPFAKERPRVTQNGVYMEASYRRKREALRRRFGPVQVGGYLKLTLVAVRPMPTSWGEEKRRLMLGEPAKPAPDLDNIIGAVMDALFPDGDDHVVSLEAHKIWGERGQLHITLEKMGD